MNFLANNFLDYRFVMKQRVNYNKVKIRTVYRTLTLKEKYSDTGTCLYQDGPKNGDFFK